MKIRSLLLALCVLSLNCGCVLSKSPATVQASQSELSERAIELKKHVSYLAEECYPRSVNNPENQEKVVSYIKERFTQSGAQVSLMEVPVDDRTFHNVVARFPGQRKDVLVIGAHYDSYDDTPGADDNASAVAGLLELAKMLRTHKPYFTIELVAYCNEEPPYFRSEHMGSAHHARFLKDSNKKVLGMICLEMIGYFSEEPNSQDYPLEAFKKVYPTTGNFLAVVGNVNSTQLTKSVKNSMSQATWLPIVHLISPNVEGLTIDFSDHRSYWAAGIPAVMITDTAFYRNKNYHKKSDTPDTLDYVKMDQAVQALYKAVTDIDKKDTSLLTR